jgi:hypothetical protein
MPANAYLGLYIDSEGPSGIIKDLPAEETPYFRFLPMFYPYVLKPAPETFVVQFGGGHLDGGGAEVGLEPRHGRGRQSRRC